MPEVKELPVNTQAEEVVPVVATEEAKVWEPVPEVKLRAVEVVELPIVVLLELGPMAILPVLASPIVRVCFLVVAMTPAASKVRLPDTEAVGVPELTFKKANLAEAEALFPIRTSRVSLMGDKAPLVIRQLEEPPPPEF